MPHVARMLPRRPSCLLLAVLSCSVTLAGDDTVPEGALLHQRFITAVGGPTAIRNISAMTAHGTIHLPGADSSGHFDWKVADGGRCVFHMDFPGLGASTFGSDGTTAWEIIDLGEARRTVQEIDIADLERRRTRSNWFELALTLGDRSTSFETLGPSVFDAHQAWEVRMVDHADRVHQLYFDQDSALLLGVRMIEEGPLGSADVTVRFAHWKPVGDLKLFHTITIDHAAIRMTLRFSSVTLDPIDPVHFTPPPDVNPRDASTPTDTAPKTPPTDGAPRDD